MPDEGTKLPAKTFLERWGITVQELDSVVVANPSLRGMMLGYISELKLRQLLSGDKRIERMWKEDDHDRRKKGDLWVRYKGVDITLEVKSLQTNTVVQTAAGFSGKFQCDGSDRRKLVFTDPSFELETTLLQVGEFDVLAVGLFEFGQQWRFGFAKNSDLPRSTYAKYPEGVRQRLLKSLMPVTWPLQHPYQADPFLILDEVVELKRTGQSEEPIAEVENPPDEQDLWSTAT